MFSTATKTTTTSPAVQQKTTGATFFRKAGEESFFGAKENPSFFGKTIQTKLTVSTPDDPHEKEADAVADKVMRMKEPVITPATLPRKKEEEVHRKEEEEVQAKPEIPIINKIQCKEDKEEKLHAKLDAAIYQKQEGHTGTKTQIITGTGNDHTIQRKNISLFHSDIIQRSGRGPPTTSIPFEQTLAASKGGGTALPGNTRQFMESRFNADFSGVRIHTDSTAEHLSSSVHAKAFAHGNDIYFNSRQFSPHSIEGGTLLAHELTHTIQQGASKSNPPRINNKSLVAKKSSIHRNANTEILQSSNNIKDLKTTRSKTNERNEETNISQKAEVKNTENTSLKQIVVQSKINLNSSDVSTTGNSRRTDATLNKITTKKEIFKKDEKPKEEEEKSSADAQHEIHKKSTDTLSSEINIRKVQQHNSDTSVRSHIQTSSTDNFPANTSDADSLKNTGVSERGPPIHRMAANPGVIIVQRSLFDSALSHVSDFLSDIPITLDIDVAKRWLMNGVRRFASYIPGYRALGVVLGHDPITGEEIAQNGRSFIEAALDIIPGGNLLKQKLDELGLIDRAAAWIDAQIATLSGIVQNVRNEFLGEWNSLGLSSILDGPTEILRRFGSIFERAINNIIDFARRAAGELLDIIKKFLLNQIVDFVKNHTNAYELLKVILGKDPITDEPVERNGTNILNALLEMGGDAGREQRRQMQETHTFEKAAAWIDRGIAVFGDLYSAIRSGFSRIWDVVSIEALMRPIDTFNQIYETFAGPVGRVLDFVRDALVAILGFIKEALMTRLSAWARTVRGYPLVTVIIGKDPFTNATVPRTVENIIHGFMSLMEGGEEQFNQLQQSGAIGRTVQRINAAVARLNMTPEYIVQLFVQLWNSFSFADLANPIAAFQRILDRFGEPIRRLIAFVVEIIKIVVEVIMQVMNFPSDLIANIIARAMQAFEMIKRDPVGFLKNLLRAIKQGFVQFFNNILRHLLAGLQGWLMSELQDSGVQAPQDFNLRGIIGWVLQILGISMDKIWEKLAQHPRIGPQRVARIRSMIDRLEGIWTFVKDVQQRGMAAIWDKIQERLSTLWDTILDAIKNWIMEQVVNRVTARLLSMLDPTGIMAVINSAIVLYRAVQSFIRYLRQMLEIVNSFVEGVVQIASGNITVAANFLERSMARAVPVMIGFLANQVGLSGLGRRIGEMIGRVRGLVDQALTWLVNKAVDMGMNLLDRVMALGRSAVEAVRNALGLRRSFRTTDQRDHSVSIEGDGSIIVASTPKPVQTLVAERRTQIEAENTNTPAKVTENTSKISALDRILALKALIDGLIPQYNAAADGSRTRADQIRNTINGHMNEIVEKLIVAGIEIEGSNNIETHVTHTELDGSRASHVVAEPLTTIPGNTTGSQPHEDTPGKPYVKASVWTSNWVGAHLLNHHLHGPGVAWNMVSGTKETNNNMKTEVENTAKNEISSHPEKQYYYNVSVTYYAEQPTKPFMKFFPFQINLQWGELLGQRGSWTRGPARGRTFTQDSPDMTNTVMPAFNESSATRLWEAARDAGVSVPQSVFDNIVDARRGIPSQSFGNDVNDLISHMDAYYASHGLAPVGRFTTLYGGQLRTLAANYIFMHY